MGILRNVFKKKQKVNIKPIQAKDEVEKAVFSQEDIDRFVAAAKKGNISTVRDMLREGINPNALDQHGWPAITDASQNGFKDVVELLLKNHADPDMPSKWNRETALMRAASYGHIQVVNLLLKYQANVNVKESYGKTALIYAAYAGNKDIVQLLISHGADVGGSAWESAAEKGHIDILDLLKQAGAEGEKNQEEVFVLSAARGDFDTVIKLLNSGMDANIKVYDGLTALISSANNGHEKIIDLLLSRGAIVNISDGNGNTPLMKATEKGHTGIVKRLIKAGADVNAQDIAGFSALLLAVYEGHLDIVQLLLEGGASPNSLEPLSAKTVFTIAKEKGYKELAEILIKWGARETIAHPEPPDIKITDLGD